jgi:hypothetical protein
VAGVTTRRPALRFRNKWIAFSAFFQSFFKAVQIIAVRCFPE